MDADSLRLLQQIADHFEETGAGPLRAAEPPLTGLGSTVDQLARQGHIMVIRIDEDPYHVLVTEITPSGKRAPGRSS